MSIVVIASRCAMSISNNVFSSTEIQDFLLTMKKFLRALHEMRL